MSILIYSYLKTDDASAFLDWVKKDGKEMYDSLSRTNKALYPCYFEELEGFAAGAGIPFETLLPLNLYELLVVHDRYFHRKYQHRIQDQETS
jgi:hypothetical protein